MNDKEKIYIPNEIFDDFNKNEHINSKNMAFLYCYYGLICYLFRYCKYGIGEFFNNAMIKTILGYAADNEKIDKWIKKGGVLDQTGYTRTVRDFPVEYKLDGRWIEFVMYSQLDKEMQKIWNMPKNFGVKIPVKGMYRWKESEQEQVYDGTFYEIDNTHLFEVNVMIQMIEDGMGLTGFYIYQYISHKNNMYKEGYNVGRGQLEKETGIPNMTIRRYIKELEEKEYLKVKREENKGEVTGSNMYTIIQKIKTPPI